MIKGVIFDMDGVLVDNRDAHIEAFEIICRKYGVPFDREKFMPTFGMTNDLILERLMPEVIKTTDWKKIAVEKENIYREIFERTIAPAKGLVDFLKALKKEGEKTRRRIVGQHAERQLRARPLRNRRILRCHCQRRHDHPRQARSGGLPAGS